jgi:hypothetical protein
MSIRWSKLLGYTKLPTVPCPYFLPVAPRNETEWFRPPRSPLGVLHTGACHATSGPVAADATVCNIGYARGQCPRFPEDAVADALRFSIVAKTDESIEVLYVFETAHLPIEQGRLRFSLATQTLTGAETRPVLKQQALAFLNSAA